MADKIWTATDIKMGTLRLKREDTLNTLYVTQGYEYTDANVDVIEDLPKKVLSLSVNYAAIPTDIIEALIKIFDYTHQQALVKEGME